MARTTVQGKTAHIAERTKVKAAIGIDGLSGSGKTGLALLIASILADKDYHKIYAIDTENQSMKLYRGKKMHNGEVIGEFWHAPLTKEDGYSAFNYEYYRKDAYSKDCTVLIQDSYTHAWQRQGGILDEVNKLQAKDSKFNKYTAWGHPDIIDAKNLIFELVRDDKMHVISTIRVKEAYAMQTVDGVTKVISLGEQQMQTDGLQYEFDLLLSMLSPGTTSGKPPKFVVDKSRYDIFEKDQIYDATPELLQSLKEYLETGIDIDELNEKTRKELAIGLKDRALGNKNLYQVFVNLYPNCKIADLNLKQLRELNSKFIEIEQA
jgi:energy-coupling factor transporter ATP-binding protein EcfA2